MDTPHAVEDVSQVVSSLSRVWQTTVWSGVDSKTVNATRAPGDVGASHLLDGGNTSKSPQVTVADPRELLLDLLHERTSDIQSSVSAMQGFGFETHGGVVAELHQKLRHLDPKNDRPHTFHQF